MIFNFLKKKEDTVNKCVFCERTIEEHEKVSKFSYEAIGDDGTLQEFEFGKICQSCADVLDNQEYQDHLIIDDEMEEDNER